jgi:hypothetical protein
MVDVGIGSAVPGAVPGCSARCCLRCSVADIPAVPPLFPGRLKFSQTIDYQL